MSPEIYDELFQQVEEALTRQNTNWRESIPAKVRFSMTLRHLALGDAPASLAQQYRVSKSGAGRYIQEGCVAIF